MYADHADATTDVHGESRIKVNERVGRETDPITHQIIGASFEVLNQLKYGLAETVYEKALEHELSLRGVQCETQKALPVAYKGVQVGDFRADMYVEGKVICELKVVKAFLDEHVAQLINYLKLSGIEVGLLMNFAHPRLQWKRILNDESICADS